MATSASAGTGQAEDVKLEPAAGASAAEDRCPICLEDYTDKAFVDACFHAFCFECICRSCDVGGARCPMCKTGFKVIIHNVRANDDYDVFRVKPKSSDSSRAPFERINLDEALRTFRGYRTTVLPGQPRLRPTLAGITTQSSSSLTQDTITTVATRESETRQPTHPSAYRTHRRSRKCVKTKTGSGNSRKPATLERRRAVYSTGLRAKPLEECTGRKIKIRDISSTFFRENPACTHRLVPWLTREFNVLVGEEHVEFLIQIVLSLVDKIDLESPDFATHLQPFLNEKTAHFMHELTSFAKSPYDMVAYDNKVKYDWPEGHPIRESGGWDETEDTSQPGPSGLSSTEDVQQRILDELTTTRWDDSPPIALPPLSPVLIHDSDSEPPILISDDNDENMGEELDDRTSRDSVSVLQISQDSSSSVLPSDNQQSLDNTPVLHSNDLPDDVSPSVGNIGDGHLQGEATNTVHNDQNDTPSVNQSGTVSECSTKHCHLPELSSRSMNTDIHRSVSSTVPGGEAVVGNTVIDSERVTSASEVTSTTFADPMQSVPVPQNDDVIHIGQSSNTPGEQMDDSCIDEELLLFADEEQFPSGLETPAKATQDGLNKSMNVIPPSTVNTGYKKSQKSSSKRLSGDQTTSGTEKGRDDSNSLDRIKLTKDNKSRLSAAESNKIRSSKKGRHRSRSTSHGKSPRRDSHRKSHRHHYSGDSSEDEYYHSRKVRSKTSSRNKNSVYKSGSKERSRRHQSHHDYHVRYHGDHDYDRLRERDSPYYKRDRSHRTKLYSDDFTVDRTQHSDNKELKREGLHYRHETSRRDFRSRSRSGSSSSKDSSLKYSSRKQKASSSRKQISSSQTHSVVVNEGDETRNKLSQELDELDEQIKENKKELLKSMLRRERMELIQRHLHQPSTIQSDCFHEEHKPVDCKVASANEMIQELSFLDQAIVDGKKQLLKVMKRMEEDEADRDSD